MTVGDMTRAALATIEAADAAPTLAELPVLLLPALVNLVDADCALWTEMDATSRHGQVTGTPVAPRRVFGYPEPLLTEDLSLALEQHARDFPLTRHTRPGGDGRPIRRSDLQSMRSFRNSGIYTDVARVIGVDQMLAMAIRSGRLHICISLNRAGRDFTATNVDIITQLRPLLTRRVALLCATPHTNGVPQLTDRQRQILRLVADGLTDAAIAHRLDCSPRTVDKHLEHIYRRLGVSCRTAAIVAVGGQQA
jgi:DNA-binding CsgD family transcriptional regulator